MFLADTLSRHFINDTSNVSVHQLRSEFEKEFEQPPDPDEISHLTVSQELTAQIREETDRDEVLQAVKAMIQSGWPDSKRNIAPEVSPYFPFRDELVVEEGLIMRGDRLVASATRTEERTDKRPPRSTPRGRINPQKSPGMHLLAWNEERH